MSEGPLKIPASPSPNPPSGESRQGGFGRGRGAWHALAAGSGTSRNERDLGRRITDAYGTSVQGRGYGLGRGNGWGRSKGRGV